MNAKLDLHLPPEWRAIQATWDRALGLFGEQGLDADSAHGLAMTTQELLENAVKYGRFDPGGGSGIYLAISVRPADVTIEVRHPVDPDPARTRALDDTIQWIRGFQNPFEAYVERLKQVAARPYTPGESGLGLTRVAYEGQCILDFYVDQNDTLAVSAVYLRR